MRCQLYTWCPADVPSGCGIPAANATFSSVVPPGGCITSWDPAVNRTALFYAGGQAVPFIAGEFDPANAAAGGGGGARRLLQAGSVWSDYTYQQHRFYQAIDGLPAITASTAEECAEACRYYSTCFFWTRCPTEAGSAGCEVASFTPNASPQIVPVGTCLLSYDGTKNQAAYFQMLGTSVAFEGGYLNRSSAAPSPSPSPAAPGPAIGVPATPGMSPGAGPGAPGPPAAAGSLILSTLWAGSPEQGKCYKWNGTDFEEDASSAFTSSGTTKIVTSKFEPYQNDLCSSGDTAARTMAAGLLEGGEAARMAFAATTIKCPGASGSLFDTLLAWIRNNFNDDIQFVVKHARGWVEAGDELGWAACVTVVTTDRTTGQVTKEETVKPA